MLTLVVSYTYAILVGSIIFAIYKYLTGNFVYWSKKGIVHVKPSSILTPFYNCLWKQFNYGVSIQMIYQLFPNEKMIGYFSIRRPELIIKDPDMIKQVLVKDFSAFPERMNDIVSNTSGINFNLFCAQGDAWRAMRLKFTPAFTSIKLKHMYKLISEKGAEFEKFIEKNVKKNEIQDVRDLTARFTTDVIGSCAFGVQAKSMSDSNSLFRRMGKKVFETSWHKFIVVIIGIFTPKVFEYFKMRVHTEKVENFFVSTMTDIIAERKKTDTKRQDFVDILLELKGKGYIKTDSLSDNKIEFTDTFMAAQAFIFFAAGFETSSTLMAMVLYELAMNPYAQDKLLVDIRNALNKHDGVMSYEAMQDMEYLQCAMNETMRKYPALGNLTRICATTYTFPGTNLTIEEGVRICIPVYAIHNDPKYYPEPEKFIPERFTPEAMQKRHPMVFLPFGEGPRNCIGLRFAKMQSMVGLVSFLTKYSVEPCEKTEPKIIFNPLAMVTMPKNGVFLKIKPRS